MYYNPLPYSIMGQEISCGTAGKKEKDVEFTKKEALKMQTANSQQPILFKRNSLKSDTYLNKSNVIIPQHESVVKISLTPFAKSIKIGDLYSERTDTPLSEIIEQRFMTQTFFPYPELLSLIECLAYSLSYFKRRNFEHHDFYPTQIFYCDETFKISNPLTVESTGSGYKQTVERTRFSFLSPELIEHALSGATEEEISTEGMYKGDVYAIGMILLQFSTLKPSSTCYDENTYEVLDYVIQERLNEIESIYSSKMASLVGFLLDRNIKKRLTPEALANSVYVCAEHEKAASLSEERKKRNIEEARQLQALQQLRQAPPLQRPSQDIQQMQMLQQQRQQGFQGFVQQGTFDSLPSFSAQGPPFQPPFPASFSPLQQQIVIVRPNSQIYSRPSLGAQQTEQVFTVIPSVVGSSSAVPSSSSVGLATGEMQGQMYQQMPPGPQIYQVITQPGQVVYRQHVPAEGSTPKNAGSQYRQSKETNPGQQSEHPQFYQSDPRIIDSNSKAVEGTSKSTSGSSKQTSGSSKQTSGSSKTQEGFKAYEQSSALLRQGSTSTTRYEKAAVVKKVFDQEKFNKIMSLSRQVG